MAPAELYLTDKNGDLAQQFPACASTNASERPLGRSWERKQEKHWKAAERLSDRDTPVYSDLSASQGLFNLIKPLS